MAIAFCIFSFGVAKYIYGRFSEKAVLGEIKKAQEFMLWGVIALFILVSIWGIIKILQGVVGIDNNDIKVQTFNFDSGYSDKKDNLTIELEKEAPSGGNKNIGKLELEKIDTGGLTYNIPPTTILYKDPNLTPIKGDGNQNEPDKKTSTLPKTFTITFVCAEGATCPSEKMIEEGQAIGEVKEPVLDDDYINDYTFKGWSLERINDEYNKDKIKIYTSEEIKVKKPTESLTFYNNYEDKTPPVAPVGGGKNEFTISFSCYEGLPCPDKQKILNPGFGWIPKEVPIWNDGKVFEKWVVRQNNFWTDATKYQVINNITFHAQYTSPPKKEEPEGNPNDPDDPDLAYIKDMLTWFKKNRYAPASHYSCIRISHINNLKKFIDETKYPKDGVDYSITNTKLLCFKQYFTIKKNISNPAQDLENFFLKTINKNKNNIDLFRSEDNKKYPD